MWHHASKLAVKPPSVFKIENYIHLQKRLADFGWPLQLGCDSLLGLKASKPGHDNIERRSQESMHGLVDLHADQKNQMTPAYEAIYQTSQNIHDAFLQLIPSTAGSGIKGKIKDRKLVKMAQMLVEKVAQESSSSNNCLGMLQKMKQKQLAQPEKPGLQLLTGSAGSAPGVVSLPLTDEKQSKLEEQPEQKPSLLHMPAEPESAKIVEPTNVGKSLEDYEQEAFDALVKKKACSKQGLQEACFQAASARKVEQDCQNCSCTK